MTSVKNMTCTTLRLFKAVVLNKNLEYKAEKGKEIKELQNQLLSVGVFIEPSTLLNAEAKAADIKELAEELYSVKLAKINSTFYKTFEEMQSKSEFELLIDQLVHYGSTYGEIDAFKNHGDIYEPKALNESAIAELQKFVKKFTILEGITIDELTEKVNTLFNSGIALNSDDVEDLMELVNHYKLPIDYALVKNKEVATLLAEKYGIMPANFDEFMRFVFKRVTGSTLLIKDPLKKYAFEHMQQTKADEVAEMFTAYIKQFGLKQVTENVMRYRKFVLLIRKKASQKYNKLFNVITKRSKTDKKPRVNAVMNNVANPTISLQKLEESAKKATPFQIVRAINALQERELVTGETDVKMLYRIRNGKTWLTTKDFDKGDASLIKERIALLTNILVDKVGHNVDKKVIFAPINYAVPVSTKQFVSDATPEYTTIHVDGDLKIGVAWDKSADLDLHARTLTGVSLGWNSSYSNQGVYYSGDMTRLNQQGFAAEYMLFEHGKATEPALVTISPYSIRTDEDFSYDLIVSNDKQKIDRGEVKNLMTTYQNIVYKDKISVNPNLSRELALVIPTDNGFDVILTQGTSSIGHNVPRSEVQDTILQIVNRKNDSRYKLHDLLGDVAKDAIVFLDKQALLDYLDANELSIDDVLDLSYESMTQDTLIGLLSEETK